MSRVMSRQRTIEEGGGEVGLGENGVPTPSQLGTGGQIADVTQEFLGVSYILQTQHLIIPTLNYETERKRKTSGWEQVGRE